MSLKWLKHDAISPSWLEKILDLMSLDWLKPHCKQSTMVGKNLWYMSLFENTLHSLRNSVNKEKRACIHVALCMQNPATLITTLSILFNQENEVIFFIRFECGG